jgi:hypothetical protein
VDEPKDRLVGYASEQMESPLELARLDLWDEADGTVEEPDEPEERGEPFVKRRELLVARVGGRRGLGLDRLLLEDRDDRIAFTELPLRDDTAEPLPVVADGKEGRPGRPSATDPARFGNALDDPPRLGFGESEARGAMAQPEGFADLTLGERLLAGHEIRLHPGDRRGHPPRGAHLAPRLGELESDPFGRPRSVAVRGSIDRRAAVTAPGRNVRLDSSVLFVHNLLCQGSTLDRGEVTMHATQAPTAPVAGSRGAAAVIGRPSRMLGASVALVIAVVASVATMMLADSPVAFAGIPAAGLLGGLLAPRLRVEDGLPFGAALAMAAGCVPLGAFTLVTVAGGDPIAGIALAAIGVVILGLPAFFLLIAPAIAWASATTWLARHGWS